MIVDPHNRLVQFLVFCAGSSHDVLEKCPTSEWNKHASIGATVLFTAILALLSSFYAFQVVFHAFYVSIPLALFWALIIFNLDRFIVSSFRKNGKPVREFVQALPRILLAVAIAVVISKPLEMEIFKTEINQVLSETKTRKLSDLQTRHEAQTLQHAAQSKQLQEEMDKYFSLKEKYYLDYICECDGTCGTGQKGRGSECKAKMEKYNEFVKEFNVEKARIDLAMAELAREKKRLTAEYVAERERIEINFSTGFLARLNALNGMGGMASLSITMLLILIEITPVFSKLMAPEGPYDNLMRMGENEFKLRYMRTVYRQNVELHGGGMHEPEERPAAPMPEGKRGEGPLPLTDKYAALRLELQKKLKQK